MRTITVLYFLLLTYIVAAIVFWGHELDKQSQSIYHSEIRALNAQVDSINQYELYRAKKKVILGRLNARKQQYSGEGATFLLVTLIGVGIVYSTMRSRNRLAQQQSNFILSITHELKSPIAAVKLNLQTLSHRKNLDETTQQTLIERSVTEANRLNDLCNNLLLASRMEDRHFKSDSERINLSKLLLETATIMETRKKVAFEKDIEPEIFTIGDALLWRLTINNLLENAVKYGHSEFPVAISLKKQEEQLLLSIKDNGQGIPDEEKSKIFKKFYRIGNENARKTKGTGLGLYLTAKIIREFKGSISVSDNEPEGSVFDISVPLA